MKQRIHLTWTTIGIVMAGCSFPGQRALHVRLEQDGQLVAKGFFSVPDSFDRQATWQRLEGVSLEPGSELTPESSDPSRVVLNGKIRVVLDHAGRPYALAETTQLRLDADPAKRGHWQLAPAEVARTGKSLK
jgi:hypothetical protein